MLRLETSRIRVWRLILEILLQTGTRSASLPFLVPPKPRFSSSPREELKPPRLAHVEKKNSFFYHTPYGETDAFSPEKPGLNTRETHFPIHGLAHIRLKRGKNS